MHYKHAQGDDSQPIRCAHTLPHMSLHTPLQNRWIVAGTVYDSLVASGRLDEGVLARFDGRGDDLLHPFRFLNQVGDWGVRQHVFKHTVCMPVVAETCRRTQIGRSCTCRQLSTHGCMRASGIGVL